MTKAVAEKGVQLIKGVHIGSQGDCVITIKQSNGIVREVPYRDDDVATPVLVEAMIQDKGIESPEIREAATRYCLSFIEGINDATVGTLSCYVEAFEQGYKAALK
ncbi:MAG: hypothetical protein A2Y60_01805 [Chloroflexi bacterium RBG_13_54_9]|nr:MAG: hypothetical protein A2Y60_01805 [Chloroflexi bacterium RBG_13_54_9]